MFITGEGAGVKNMKQFGYNQILRNSVFDLSEPQPAKKSKPVKTETVDAPPKYSPQGGSWAISLQRLKFAPK